VVVRKEKDRGGVGEKEKEREEVEKWSRQTKNLRKGH
jgi:hypothetical protein